MLLCQLFKGNRKLLDLSFCVTPSVDFGLIMIGDVSDTFGFFQAASTGAGNE